VKVQQRHAPRRQPSQAKRRQQRKHAPTHGLEDNFFLINDVNYLALCRRVAQPENVTLTYQLKKIAPTLFSAGAV
jgi:hypothetical protein